MNTLKKRRLFFKRILTAVIAFCLSSYAFSSKRLPEAPSVTECKQPQLRNESKKRCSLKVMSYNIHIASPPSLPDYTPHLQPVADVIDKERPDIVALQEVDVYTVRSGKQSHQAEALGKLTGMHYYFAKGTNKSEGEYGVAILSRHPISEAEGLQLPTMPESNGETRGMAVVKVKIKGEDVIFISVHLDHLSDQDRIFQVRQLLQHTQQYANCPIVFSGDFNTTRESEVFTFLEEQDFIIASEVSPPTFPSDKPRNGIDHILLNKKARERFRIVKYYTINESYPSDHLPLVIELNTKK